MKQFINLENWNRKEHFLFFSRFDDPFFGMTVNVDCTSIYNQCKEENKSFFLLSLHKILKAVNKTEPFRLRIENDQVVCYDLIHASPTIGRDDGTFGFGFFEYEPDFNEFVTSANNEIDSVQKSVGLNMNEVTKRADVIHFSSIPWACFTDLKHATSFRIKDSVPKISVGKYFLKENHVWLPLSITVHHGLIDGYHVGQFLQKLETEML